VNDNPLSQFHPLVADWFKNRFGVPTQIQLCASQTIARGDHVLLSAPTGSGKTLAAFLWELNHLICANWTGGCTRVLYVSPLKALNNDVQRNLLKPLSENNTTFARIITCQAGIDSTVVR
jgi:ATP-dependent Lhr-like helicase